MIMEIKVLIQKHSQVFKRVGSGYRGFTNFIPSHQYISFPWEGCNFGFSDGEFHILSSAPIFYKINVRLLSLGDVMAQLLLI
jgi:hypothetical protein